MNTTSRYVKLSLLSCGVLLFAACTTETPTGGSQIGLDQQDPVHISEPLKFSAVISPLTVKAEAPGSWFSEAQLTLKVLDKNGKLVGTGVGTADGEWMTEAFVPFTGTVSFSSQETSGFLVVEADNPSGDPANAKSFKIPVKF